MGNGDFPSVQEALRILQGSGTTTTSTRTTSQTRGLETLADRIIIDPGTGRAYEVIDILNPPPSLQMPPLPGLSARWFLRDRETGSMMPLSTPEGDYVTLDGDYISVNERGNIVGRRSLTSKERDALGLSLLPSTETTAAAGGAGGGGGVDQAALARLQSQLEEEAAQREFERQKELLRLQQEFERQEAERQRQEALRRQRLEVLSGLISDIMQQQQRGRELLAQLQPDPFRFAAAMAQMPTLGVTPQQAFRGQLQEFVQHPLPKVDVRAPLSEIERGIASLTGVRVPLPPQTFGMAQGGVVGFGPPTGVGVLVGEQGPEVMEVGPAGVRVIPLVGRAQGGFSTAPLEQALGPLFGGLGTIPRVTGRPWEQTFSLGTLRSLGISPRLVRITKGPERNAVFYIDPVTGQRRHIRSPQEFRRFGFSWREVVGLPSQEVLSIPEGPPLTAAPEPLGISPRLVRITEGPERNAVFYIDPVTGQRRHIRSPQEFRRFGFSWREVVGLPSQEVLSIPEGPPLTAAPEPRLGLPQPFGPAPFLFVEPTTGAILPMPFRVAAALRTLAETQPDLFQTIASAYEMAGFPLRSLEQQIALALPSGPRRGIIGFR